MKKDSYMLRLNQLKRIDLSALLYDCCEAPDWIEGMLSARPYHSLEDFLNKANQTWDSLSSDNVLAAIKGHPLIGAKKTGGFSEKEQKKASQSSNKCKIELSELNQIYYEKFGFIFLICASEKSAEEIILSLKKRLKNKKELEIKLASKELKKINELRLKKIFLEQNKF